MKPRALDLSCLTQAEQQQIAAEPSIITSGNTAIALYMRYSSDRQTEQSIEGQLRVCIEYCKRKKYRISAIYIDRATSAHKDIEKRVEFQRMIADSAKADWSVLLVYKLDRFARSRQDSAISKMRLKKNGVSVESATEEIASTPEGIILESVLEGLAEYYSVELSQKITRGLRESALKGNSVGGRISLGYKIENKKLVIDPVGAKIVREAFDRYAAGESCADIIRAFNTKGYLTAKGVPFNRSSFKSLFKNERYIGTYMYKDIRIENAIPPIVEKDTFEQVQNRLKAVAAAPARGKAKVNYLLSGKIFCGHCGEHMNGDTGRNSKGVTYNYYTCYARKRAHSCDKKPVPKEWIETVVAQAALDLLTDDVIEELADMAIKQKDADILESRIPELTAKIKECEISIKNLSRIVERGVDSEDIINRITELSEQKKSLTKQLDTEEKTVPHIDKYHIIYWLSRFKNGDIEDDSFKRQLIDMLVNSVTVYDETDGFRVITAYNLTSKPTETFRIDDKTLLGLQGFNSTISRKSEQIIIEFVFVQSRKYPLSK